MLNYFISQSIVFLMILLSERSDDLLFVINDTGSWLMVTNGSNLFMIMFSINKSNCEHPDGT